MGLAVGLWSLFCGLTAVATGFYSMLVLRVLFGMAGRPDLRIGEQDDQRLVS